jgi:hypothetical protein
LLEGTCIPSRRERDRDTLTSKPQISSKEIAPFHAKVLREVVEFEGNFEVQRNKSQQGGNEQKVIRRTPNFPLRTQKGESPRGSGKQSSRRIVP